MPWARTGKRCLLKATRWLQQNITVSLRWLPARPSARQVACPALDIHVLISGKSCNSEQELSFHLHLFVYCLCDSFHRLVPIFSRGASRYHSQYCHCLCLCLLSRTPTKDKGCLLQRSLSEDKTKQSCCALKKFWVKPCTGFAWPGFGTGGAAGMASVRGCTDFPCGRANASQLRDVPAAGRGQARQWQ